MLGHTRLRLYLVDENRPILDFSKNKHAVAFLECKLLTTITNVNQNKARALKNTLRGFYKLLDKDTAQRLIGLEQYRILDRILRYVKITKLNVNSQK